MSAKGDYSVPQAMRKTYDTVVNMTDHFCHEHLNEEYAELSRKMAAALSRKRPSPLASGRTRSWAAGILYALAQVNFLFDKSFEPYMSATELCQEFGVSQGTASNKAREISKRLDLMPMDPEWCLPSLLEKNPLAWFIEVNGFIVDARMMPRDIQEEAYRLGLIPYVPEQKRA